MYTYPNHRFVGLILKPEILLKVKHVLPYRKGKNFRLSLCSTAVNGEDPENDNQRRPFDELTPIFIRMSCITLENPQNPKELATRLSDPTSPIGKGQRGLIVSPPKAGKTTLLKKIANSIAINHPDIYLIVLLIDERPEESNGYAEIYKRRCGIFHI